MKLHSNIITAVHLLAAADYAKARAIYGRVYVDWTWMGSRTRTRSAQVYLGGDGTVARRRPNFYGRSKNPHDYAATYCQWGDFLAYLFDQDPDMHCANYAGREDFHHRTAHAFDQFPEGPCDLRNCSSCPGTMPVPMFAPLPKPTRMLPEEVTAERQAQRAAAREADRLFRERVAAEDAERAARRAQRESDAAAARLAAAPTQRDIVAEIERTIDAYVAAQPTVNGDTAVMQAGELADDPCGYRFC